MAQSDIKSHRDLKAFTTKTSEHKWHNTDKQILLTKVQGCTRFVKPRRSKKIIRSSGSGKLLNCLKANPTTKEVTYDEFIALTRFKKIDYI
jgi:hypothetical protein